MNYKESSYYKQFKYSLITISSLLVFVSIILVMITVSIYRKSELDRLEQSGGLYIEMFEDEYKRSGHISSQDMQKLHYNFSNQEKLKIFIYDEDGKCIFAEGDYDQNMIEADNRFSVSSKKETPSSEVKDLVSEIKKEVNPAEILLVIDAMTGQEAANVAQTFNEKLDVTGIILSKLDSDTRGGAALSVRTITGKPVKFASSGEKINDFEVFYPKRMADRILGMGDVLTLIDKAVEMYDEKQAQELEKKIMTQTFTLDDFLEQLQQIKKMGGIGKLLKLIPGAGQINEDDIDERQLVKIEAIIRSMTKKEKRNPDVLNASRRKRIAAGSGTTVQDVNRLMKQFEDMRAMMKKLGGKGKKGIGRKLFGGKMPNDFM